VAGSIAHTCAEGERWSERQKRTQFLHHGCYVRVARVSVDSRLTRPAVDDEERVRRVQLLVQVVVEAAWLGAGRRHEPEREFAYPVSVRRRAAQLADDMNYVLFCGGDRCGQGSTRSVLAGVDAGHAAVHY
jgi:hypothetical protein